MEGLPLVSVVTPCFNGLRWLSAYLASLLGQTWPRFELILADDGSTDGSAELIESWIPRFASRGVTLTLLRLEHHGQAAAVREGLQRARGEYLAWPDADDVLEPESLAARVAFLEAHPDYGMVRSDRYFIDGTTGARSEGGTYPQPKDDRLFDALLLERLVVCCGCYLLRLADFDRVCPSRDIPDCLGGQNYQLLLPMAYRYPCGYLPEKLYGVTLHPDSNYRQKRTWAQD